MLLVGILASATHPVKIGVRLVIDTHIEYDITDGCVIFAFNKNDLCVSYFKTFVMSPPIEVIDWQDQIIFVFKVKDNFIIDYFAIVNSLAHKVSKEYIAMITNTFNLANSEPHFMVRRYTQPSSYIADICSYMEVDPPTLSLVEPAKYAHPEFNIENETIYCFSYNYYV